MILAAGRGTRLGDLGASLPKPMLRLAGRPVLEWTLETLRAADVEDVVINLHHAGDVIRTHFGDGSGLGMRIQYVFEPDLLGTAGAVRNAHDLLEGDRFLVVYGDTVLDWDPRPMIADHEAARALATIAVSEVADPSRMGVVAFGEDRRITGFVEKPGPRPELGRWVNAGLYVLEPAIFEHIPETGFSDFGLSIFPGLLAENQPLRAYLRPQPVTVLDTPEQLAAAQRDWSGEA
jgi:NDP-sugar pyrophosphorylase family protein